MDPAALAQLGGIEFIARRVVEGFLMGLHRSPHRGFSAEFAEHRAYQAGDDLRHIDWRMFARSDRYYVKQYEEDTNLRCTLLVDVSGSMRYGRGALSKYESQRGSGVFFAVRRFRRSCIWSEKDSRPLTSPASMSAANLGPLVSSTEM